MTPSSSPKQSSALASGIATLVWRLFLLVVGGGLAFGGGVFWAMHNPQLVTEKPFAIKLWQSWQTTFDASSSSTSAATPPTEAEDLINQIQQLQAQADQPGADSEAISAQLDTLQQQLTNATPSSNSALPTDKLKVTLPSDFLFSSTDSSLSPEAKKVLDEFVVRDLQAYEGNTVLIAAYTDVEDNPQLNRELSFRRAKAIENYLSQALEGNYRWIATGYGKDQSQDNTESLLNRRVEIAVD